MRKVLTLLVISVGCSYALPNIGGEVSLGAMTLNPSGYIQYQGDRLDVDVDLALGNETKLFGRIKLEIPVLRLEAYQQLSSLDRPVVVLLPVLLHGLYSAACSIFGQGRCLL